MSNYKTGQAAFLLGIDIKTLQRYDRLSIYRAKRTATNRRYYDNDDLEKLKIIVAENKRKSHR
jgi:putative resolvase